MKSIYDTICDNLDSNGCLPVGEPLKLPDHHTLDSDIQENWVPGEFEAVMVRLPYRIKELSFINYLIARTVRNCIKTPSQKNKQKLFEKLKKYATVSIADPVLSHLAGMSVDRVKAARLARELITKTDNRAFVKFGIVLIGAYGTQDDCDIVSRIGAHEEFTFFAAKALKNLDKTSGYQDRLVELAEKVEGWGKVAVIFEFSDHALADETREWILRRGCKNNIALHFTACECAIKGKLGQYINGLSALDGPNVKGFVNAELTEGICDIIEGLLQGSSLKEADGVNEVPDARGLAVNLKRAFELGAFSGSEARLDNLIQRLHKYLSIK